MRFVHSDMGSGVVLTRRIFLLIVFSKQLRLINVGNLKHISNVCTNEIGLRSGLK